MKTKTRKKLSLEWNASITAAIAVFEVKSPQFELCSLFRAKTSSQFSAEKALSPPLLHQQAKALSLPLQEIGELSAGLTALKEQGSEVVAFLDLDNEAEKVVKEKLCQKLGLRAVFPLWKWKSKLILQAFEGLGHKAFVYAVDTTKLSEDFVAREFNSHFASQVTGVVDPCGRNGEFATFTTAGPFFDFPIPVRIGELQRDGDWIFRELHLSEESLEAHNRMN